MGGGVVWGAVPMGKETKLVLAAVIQTGFGPSFIKL